jgi:hypothetical protein
MWRGIGCSMLLNKNLPQSMKVATHKAGGKPANPCGRLGWLRFGRYQRFPHRERDPAYSVAAVEGCRTLLQHEIRPAYLGERSRVGIVGKLQNVFLL